MRFLSLGLLVTSLVIVSGCGRGARYAPVSGIVKVNGEPYPKAVVSFQPIGTKDNPNPGRGSSAFTDENGRFVLKGVNGQNGAVVGKHLVRIMTKGNEVIGQDPNWSSDDKVDTKRSVDPIPPEWNALSKNEFEVPSGGTDQANFDITSKVGTKKK